MHRIGPFGRLHGYMRLKMRRIIAFTIGLVCLTAAATYARVPRAEIVFVRFGEDKSRIKSMRPGGKAKTLARGEFGYPTWSPDRSQIAFAEVNPRNGDPVALWVMNRDGSDERKLADLHGRFGVSSSYRIGFDWSPDGTKLVFSDRVDKESTYDLYIVDVASGEVTQLTSDDQSDEEEPDWSPTDDVVAYHHAPKGDGIPAEGYDVYTVDVSDGTTTQLTDNEWWDYSPLWSPDGESIAFFSTRDDFHSEDGPYEWDLWLMDADGSNERRLTEQATRKMDATWSPDGESIAYESRCDDDYCGNDYDDNIYVVDVSSGKLRRVTTKGKRGEGWPSWSPDSRWIAFWVSLRGGREADIWAIRLKDGFVKDLSAATHMGEHQWSAGQPGGTNL